MHIKCSNKHIYHDLEIQLSTFLSFKSSEQKYKETKKVLFDIRTWKCNSLRLIWVILKKKWNTRWSVKRVYFGYFGGHDSHVTWISGYTSPLYMMSPEFKCEMLLKRIIISHWIKKLSFLYSVRHSFIST